MKVSVVESIKLLGMRAGKSMAQISREMGMKLPTNLINMLARGDVKASVMSRIAEVCGYELMLVPKGTEVENGIAIKGDEE